MFGKVRLGSFRFVWVRFGSFRLVYVRFMCWHGSLGCSRGLQTRLQTRLLVFVPAHMEKTAKAGAKAAGGKGGRAPAGQKADPARCNIAIDHICGCNVAGFLARLRGCHLACLLAGLLIAGGTGGGLGMP